MSDRDARVARTVAAVAATLDARLGEITLDLREVLAGQITELDGDPRIIDLLGASIQGNVATILHMLAHDIPPEHVEPPSAAVEYARRLAQRGVPLTALIRAYRLGQDRLLRWGFAEVEARGDDAEVALHANHRLVTLTFAYVDWISQHLVAAYEDERERWLANRGTVRAARIREILARDPDAPGAPPLDGDVDADERTIGYALRRRHLGLVAWTADGDEAVAAIERFALVLAELAGCRGRPLVTAYDRSTAWIWLPLARPVAQRTDVIRAALREAGPGLRVACGAPASGVAGFRSTHRQAVRAQDVALAAGPDAQEITPFDDVGAVALLCTDLEGARTWVSDVLGPLARDDEQHARLRETLRVFLAEGGSYAAAAQRLTLHRNSVRYRVTRAQEVRGRAIRDDRLDVELALLACRWLGRAVLRGGPLRG